jgi:hypothetical protein
METVIFKKGGEALFVNFTVNVGVLAASYFVTLLESNGTSILLTYKGDNQQVNDDKYRLPLPVSTNNGRIIRVNVDFQGLDTTSIDYEMAFEFRQGATLLYTLINSGKLTGYEQDYMSFVTMKGV